MWPSDGLENCPGCNLPPSGCWDCFQPPLPPPNDPGDGWLMTLSSTIFYIFIIFAPTWANVLYFLSYRRSRRPATPSSALVDVTWPWMAWSPTLLTCCRSEPALQLDMEPAAPASSSRPAQTVSPAQPGVQSYSFSFNCSQKQGLGYQGFTKAPTVVMIKLNTFLEM